MMSPQDWDVLKAMHIQKSHWCRTWEPNTSVRVIFRSASLFSTSYFPCSRWCSLVVYLRERLRHFFFSDTVSEAELTSELGSLEDRCMGWLTQLQ